MKRIRHAFAIALFAASLAWGWSSAIAQTPGFEGFRGSVMHRVGPLPARVAVGDFNHDDIQDIAVAASAAPGAVYVLIGQGRNGFGHGTFEQSVPYQAGLEPMGLATADLDRDNHLDLVVGNGGSGDLSILLGLGDGTFAPPHHYPLHQPVGGRDDDIRHVVVADFNLDGWPDIASIRYRNPVTVAVMISRGLDGNGVPTFEAPEYPFDHIPNFSSSLASADFNLDGRPDLIAGSGYSTQIVLSKPPEPDGRHFEPSVDHRVLLGRTIVVDDFNQDGVFDVAGASDQGVGITLGAKRNGTWLGVFGPTANFGSTLRLIGMGAADWNRDGILDLVASRTFPSNLYVFLGAGENGVGNGRFDPQPPVARTISRGSGYLAVGDFNDDERPDVAISNANIGVPTGGSDLVVLLSKGTSKLSIEVRGRGEVEWDGRAYYERDEDVTLEAVPAPGSTFLKWEGSVRNESPTVTLPMDDDRFVRARFQTPIEFRLHPRNLRPWQKQAVIAYLEPYEPLVADNFDVSSVRLNGVRALKTDTRRVADRDDDGVMELAVPFDLDALLSVLPVGNHVPIEITGLLAGEDFIGRDTIKVKAPRPAHGRSAKAMTPRSIAIHPPSPNPASGSVLFTVELSDRSPVEIAVFDIQGRLRRALATSDRAAGRHEFQWFGHDDHGQRLGRGIYFVRMSAAGRVETRRFVWLGR